MSKSGKWNAVNQTDSNSFANCPYQVSTDFTREIDFNPQAPRSINHYKWVLDGNRDQPRVESFYRKAVQTTKDLDTDTTDDFYVDKEVILGVVIDKRGGGSFSGWSIVVRTVIRWEERRIRKAQITVYNRKKEFTNNKPEDIKRWESKNGRSLQRRKRPIHTERGSRIIRIKKQENTGSRNMGL